MRRNKISNAKINKNAEIGSHWRAPLPSIKYFVVLRPLMTHDFWSFSKILTHKIKFSPKPYFPKVEIRKLWSHESKAFSMPFITEKLMFLILVISIMSDIKLPLFPICLFFTYVVCYEEIKSGTTSFSFSKRAFDIFLILHSTRKLVSSFF